MQKRVVFLHMANTLAYFENSFRFKKNIISEFEEKTCFSMDFAKKNHFSHFKILQHVCKNPKGIDQYSKNIKVFFLGLLFTVGIQINKS